MKLREEVKASEASVLIGSRAVGKWYEGSVRTPVSGALDFSRVPLSILQRIVEAQVAR